jgi:uncharacterized membrane protein YcjF (UPF0283 family)
MLAGDFEEGIRGVLEEFSFQEVRFMVESKLKEVKKERRISMSFNFDQNRHVANRVGQEVEIKEQARKEKNRMELPDEEKRDKEDFSYKAQRRKRLYRNLTGVLGILLVLYVVYWFAMRLF